MQRQPDSLTKQNIRQSLTMKYVDSDASNVGVGRTAGIFARVCQLSVLDQQVACSHFTFLCDHANATSVGVVADYLQGHSLV